MTSDETIQSASKWCFQCGNEYAPEVATCIECGIPTTGAPPSAVHEVGDPGEEQLAYELHEWTGSGRSILDGMLNRLGIEHAWQGATLIVREADEDAVDNCIAEAEVAEMPTLDLNEPTIVYELDELSKEQHGRLLRRLDVEGISHAFDAEGNLHVYEDDEARVDEVFETLDAADATERDFGPGVEGVDVGEVMADLFVATGKLRKRPADGKIAVALVQAARIVEQMRLPFGIPAASWSQVVDQSGELADILANDAGAAEGEISERAEQLYDALRPLV